MQNDRDDRRRPPRHLGDRNRPLRGRFDLAAPRLVREWLETGSVRVSDGDFAVAREYLEQVGWQVHLAQGLVRLIGTDGRVREMTREALVLQAVRELARPR